MASRLRTRRAGVLGVVGATLFFVGLQMEYHYGLFSPGHGLLLVANQLLFTVAMSCIAIMLWHIRAAKAVGNGRFAQVVLTVFPLGWAALILGNIFGLLAGNFDNLLLPLGGLSNMLFGLLAGIVIAAGKQWHGWARFALLLEATYYALGMVILPVLITGDIEPTLLRESLWMVVWFQVGLALLLQAKRDQAHLLPAEA